ncbi:hypothetical protein CLIB1444_02S06282 [[Candida] jaroonii]|uniref:Uncharacterized protein n=1 Tax=[Candida] jaroonii TaxID=467808 RepID=A0ACA9Y306_9ASCO|nr:hypothetical protein CLIB1444_02S06282 [[Candida] jaroonii]
MNRLKPFKNHIRFKANLWLAGTNRLFSTPPTIIQENKTVSQYLADYKQWFPKDNLTNSLIDSYERLKLYPQETIKIGVIYHDEQIKSNCRMMETILADPLASNNEEWFYKIVNRNKQDNLTFEYGTSPDIHDSIYKIPSPILSSLTRPSYMTPKTNITPNDVILYEINDLSSFDRFNHCHFFIYITDNITTIKKLPSSINDRILLTIIDNSDFTPTSSESTPIPIKNDSTERIVKVNTEISYKGIVEFLKYDTKASNNYLESLVESNNFQILKIIGYNLPVETLLNWNLKKIVGNIKQQEINFKELEDLYEFLKTNVINEFSSAMHYELQRKFIPITTNFFNKKLRWYKLYWKNDDVEYVVKDFFNLNFMPESIENYNVTRGKIINYLQNHQFVNYSEIKPQSNTNPLLRLKNDIISRRIKQEIQPIVSKSILLALIYYQLPVTIISGLAYQYFDFTLNGSMAIFSLGMVVGFNYLSKKWESFTINWLKNLFDEVRIVIDKDCIEDGLIKELADRYDEERKIIDIKNDIIKGINILNK